MSDTLRIDVDSRGVATITLNRPEQRNAVDEVMIAELHASLAALAQNTSVRVLVLQANGSAFCAGADYRWMQRGLEADQHDNFEEALRLARMLQCLDRFPTPTIARVHGPALGIGVGLIACCDLIVGAHSSWFRLPEVRLGLVPAVIGPHVIAKIGTGAARRYFLTAETMTAETAKQLGLVHEVAPDEHGLNAMVGHWVYGLLQNGPHAVTTAKRLIAAVAHRPIDDALISDTAHRIAHLRAHPEARQGIRTHLDDARPSWLETLDFANLVTDDPSETTKG
ncbi:enoyl-CoA hydratase-related protein [Andreprevotia chitinilytica]|uniref:enoyl-CoA hydratase-related protein n=1 Tax=Andreprevotia chitinilytica TaxID=396808 RepID=UPI00068C2B6B|nr:enoyl-CoA hydratase-related protein [Andreprevotia chitinilytica]